MNSTQKKIRAILIQPPSIGCVQTLLSHIDEKGSGIGFKPPIGLLYIATFLKEHTSHEVKVIDAQAQGLNFQGCLQQISLYKPEVVGISVWTDWWYPAYYLGRIIKDEFPKVMLVYGGPHVSIYPKETFAFDHVDGMILGDGELPFASFCDMVATGKFHNDIPGLHLKAFGVKTGTQRFFIQKDIDLLSIPDRRLLPLENYTSVLGKSRHVTTMITSRGCPFQCTYCKLNFQEVVSRSAVNVVEEFKRIQQLGIQEVEIYDDTFTWSKTRVAEICRGLIEQGIHLEWAVRDRVNFVDSQLLELMKKAGCVRIHYGIESGVDRVLKTIKKHITVEQSRSAVRMAKEKGFTVLTYFMLGNPGETVEDIRKTVDFALELDADYAEFSITVPYPGTQMYLRALENGVIHNDFWNDFARRPQPEFYLPELIEDNFTREQLVSFRNKAIRRYYFRTKFLLRELRKTTSTYEFWRKAKMGARLFASLFRNPLKTKSRSLCCRRCA